MGPSALARIDLQQYLRRQNFLPPPAGEDIGALFVSVQKNYHQIHCGKSFLPPAARGSMEEGSASQFSLAYFYSVQKNLSIKSSAGLQLQLLQKNFAAIQLGNILRYSRDAKKLRLKRSSAVKASDSISASSILRKLSIEEVSPRNTAKQWTVNVA